jgi:5-methylthioadenosine/S-adenosylhomocysteine deaminase
MSSLGDAEFLIEPRWLLPIAPGNTVLEGQAVAVSRGRIVAVGAAPELRERYAGRARIVRERHALMPGLVNAHTRGCDTLLRGLPVRGPRARWLAETLAPLERRAFVADLVRDGTRLALAEMLRAGITSYADEAPLPEEAARVAAAAQVRAVIGLPVTDGGDLWAEDATGHLARAEALWDEYRSDARIGLYFAPQPARGLSDVTWMRLRRVADELDARVVLHLEASAPQEAMDGPLVADSAVRARARHTAGAPRLAHLQGLGLLRPGVAIVGALGSNAVETELLRRHGVSTIACPQAELRLQSAQISLPACRPSALGTDTPAAAGALDMLAETRSAALLFSMTPLEALRLATLGGATVLGLAAEVGSVEPGKSADLTCLDLDAPGCRPVSDVAATIVFAATRAQVSDVWSAGRAVVAGGRLRLFDEAELAALGSSWARRLSLDAAA